MQGTTVGQLNRMTLTLQSGGSLQSTQPTPFSKHKDLVGFNEQSFRRSVEDLNDTHERNINAYENVIRGMQEVVNSLMSKNQFLVQDQMALLMENERLRRENQELKDVFQLKQCLHSGSTPAQLPLFEVAYEQRAEGEAASQASNLYSQTSVRNPPVCVGNILENSVKSLISPLAMSRSANMIGFGNMGDSFPRLLTQNSASQNQFFMNNLKLSSQGNQLQTPGLPNQNLLITCSSLSSQGAIRAFYLTLIQNRHLCDDLARIIQEIRIDSTIILLEAYPINDLWADLLITFLANVHSGKFNQQIYILDYLRTHTLIDDLLIRILKSRVNFLFDNRVVCHDPLVVLKALANEFSLRSEHEEGVYTFYEKQHRDERMMRDSRQLEISLNSQQGQNMYYADNEQPCFTIYHQKQVFCIRFYVNMEVDVNNYDASMVESQNSRALRNSVQNMSKDQYHPRLQREQMQNQFSNVQFVEVTEIYQKHDSIPEGIKQNCRQQLKRVSLQANREEIENPRYFLQKTGSASGRSIDQ